MIKQRLQQLVDDPAHGAGRIFAWFIQLTIVVSILDFTFETIPGLAPDTLAALKAIELISIIIFSVELVLRLAFSNQGFRHLFTFFGIIDLLAILPFYLALGIDLRGVRAFRLLRLFQMFKLAKYSRSIRRFHVAFLNAREDLLLFGATALIILFVAAVGIHFFESTVQPELFGSIPHCLWWAVTTLTTVGYGDAFPITVGGKLFTFVILAVGLAVVAVPSGIMASALSQARDEMKGHDSDQTNQPEVTR